MTDKVPLAALVTEQLELARGASSGRSAKTVYGGHERSLRQTLLALDAGRRLGEHDNPGEATLHVLRGRVRLSTGDASWDGSAGDLLIVPDARHDLEAIEPAVVLLTAVPGRPPRHDP
ncbi:LuxR family transcriptional regulator [Sphaerisporangium siamense]|uniref:Quercetin dioxygenase-like cupin family protein n=1 Tax=Sphaerisporangium siamense TaxID=795645 RepID=A0A7W7D3I3_9ACTN|nr:cupin domain-containing protein [Sphaerisporangium siamense]MBB4698675.1 quercetin dioxygenase-like cupin family protein [Sphaerisporangium siamense]GII85266.1 LuxR family transcriptional regulator [Sphaerisporangium siamense]